VSGFWGQELNLKRRIIVAHENDFLSSALASGCKQTGETELIEAVIHFLKADHIHIAPENIVITSSGQQGLDLTGRLFLNPGDAVIVDRPTFAGAIVAFQMQRPVFAGVEIQDAGSDIDGFEKKIEELTGQNIPVKFIYVVPDFQNPTGISMSLAKREALLDLSYQYDIPLVEDSPYRSLRYSGDNLPAMYELDQKRSGDHVIGVYTFSKLFCPGRSVLRRESGQKPHAD
jgi:2-aminoadipate transaminase